MLFVWRREGDSNPWYGDYRTHDFQSCSFGQLGHLSTYRKLLYQIISEKSSLIFVFVYPKLKKYLFGVYFIYFFMNIFTKKCYYTLIFANNSVIFISDKFFREMYLK